MQTVMAYELRKGDKLDIDGKTRTVESICSANSETRIQFADPAFPSHIVLWNGHVCKLVAYA